MYTKNDELWYFKFQHSKNDTGSKFKHTVVDKLPILTYRFGEGDNWKANDYRVKANMDAMYKWFENYWENSPETNQIVNRGLYEKELEEAIVNAYQKINERWNIKLEREFEQAFDDKLLGFLSGEKQNKTG